MFQNPYASLIGQNQFYQQPGMNNQQFFQQQEQPQNLIRVNGLEGAKAYQMSANSIVSLFDANDDIMYIKSTDGAGFPSIRTFSFTEVKEQNKPIQQVDYISREEFEEFKKELMNNGKQSISRSKSSPTDKSSSN
jgi:hypothetical protein